MSLRVRVRLPSRRRIVLYALAGIAFSSLAAFIWIDRATVARFENRTTSLPSRVYAGPYQIQRGARLDPAEMLDRLSRLGYAEVRREPERPGEFRRRGADWTVFLRSALTPAGRREPFLVELNVRWGRLRGIRNASAGKRIERFSLEPEPLLTFYADLQEERRWTPLVRVPAHLRHAVEVVEDRRFRRHHGIDVIGTGRALVANVRAGGVVQGGSTVTQQLVKNLGGPGPRTVRRKLGEAMGAVALELHYDKDTILEAYLNEVYLGQLGPVAISGVGDASLFFFGAPVGDLDLSRSALLAGMIRNPGRYNPRRHPDRSRERRDLVLNMMHAQGVIEEAELRSALDQPLGVIAEPGLARRFPWIEDYLARSIAPLAPGAVPSRAGYSVFTTFDPNIQRAARQALADGLARVERRRGKEQDAVLEGAVVVLRPQDGALLALVGGRDHRRSQYDRAVQARRPPGSTFKPFVFLAGLERATRESDFGFTAATVVEDAPLELRAGGKLWRPENYDRDFRGPVTVREALEQSINVPTVRAAMDVGLPQIVETAHRCGIESELRAVPSVALGAVEVSPLELATAYTTLANGGFRVRPRGIEAVIDRQGEPLDLPRQRSEAVIDPALAYLVTDLLEGVLERGTARSAYRMGFDGRAAGKTGSSDGLRDAWFVGYTPELLALVWVGYDDNRPVGLPGGVAALPIWVDLMKRIGADDSYRFRRPGGIVRALIDPQTGQQATRNCPRVREEIFVKGTVPDQPCEEHGSRRRRGFWRRLFQGSI